MLFKLKQHVSACSPILSVDTTAELALAAEYPTILYLRLKYVLLEIMGDLAVGG